MLYVNVIFSALSSYCHVVFQTILNNKNAIQRIALQRTTSSYTSFLTRHSPRPTVENFSKGTCRTNDRSIIILTKETIKLRALLATSTQHVCICHSLSHEVTCVTHESKQAKRALASDLLWQTNTLRAFREQWWNKR